ncbi:uncharacterized protein LOC133372749 [Rhineura floridana]|uniref:uncharacterized protein LOC133372749 n=1 Tax=Rhineura floridana TaxID=261503 RepID=UPI002AC84214|nr:uncharacterized protein LOC133372749 [Rhineura floridana]
MSSEGKVRSEVAPESQEPDQQNVVSRVTSLPLVSSTYDMVSSAYTSTKETHPYLKSVCDVAEKGVKTIAAVAVSGAQPLLTKLEPQIATANEYACKGLDKLEEKLPILQQPSEKVAADTKELVSSTVNGAKDAVASGVSGVVGMAKGAVQGSVEMTRSVVAGGVNTVMGSRVGQMVATGVDAVLGKSEQLVDHYLPMTDQELAELATSVEGFEIATVEQQKAERSYFVRLGSLSAKLRHRAYQHSLDKLRNTKQSTQDALTQLHQTIELMEHVKQGVDQKLQGGQEKLHQMWLEWSQKQQPESDEPQDSLVQPEVEPQTLTMLRGLTRQLQNSCVTLMASVQGLPAGIQDKVRHVRHTVEALHISFSGADSFQDVPPALLAQSCERIAKARGSVDEMLDYVVQNVPLPWVVGPFAPSLVEHPDTPRDGGEKAAGDGLQPQEEVLSEKPKSPPKEPSEPKKDIYNPAREVTPEYKKELGRGVDSYTLVGAGLWASELHLDSRMASTEGDVAGSAGAEEQDQKNVAGRVASLPLVSSAYSMVSAAYASTKESYPYVKSVCDVAEKGVKTIASAAVSGAQPILSKLEPQISTANEYACKGLDKLEENLPILRQPTDKIISGTKEMVTSTVTGAKDAISSTVTGAKDVVTSTMTGMVDKTKEAVQGGVEMTRSAVTSGVNTVMGSSVGQMVASSVDAMLGKSEELVDHYLPMTDEELAKLATSVEGFEIATVEQQKAQHSYFVRLGSLSAKLRHRAYQHSLDKLRNAKQSTQDALVQLHQTIELIEHVKQGVDQKMKTGQEKLHQMWQQWSQKQPLEMSQKDAPEPEIESQALEVSRGLAQQLQSATTALVSNLQGLPSGLQEKVGLLRQNVEELRTSFVSAKSFQDLSASILAQSREKVTKLRELTDELMDHVVHNAPLSWLVGPFVASGKPEAEEIEMH